MVLKVVASALSPAGPRARLSILIFHRVLSGVDPLFPEVPDTRRFDEILSWVGQWFQVIPLDEAVLRLRAGTLPARASVITFDDGYADNATNALPILLRHGMTATFFVATSFLGGGRMWNDSVIESVRALDGNVLDLNEIGLGSHSLESNGQRRIAIDSLLGSIKHLEPGKRQELVAQVVDRTGVRLPSDLMMNSGQVLDLRNSGMQIGAHTCSHPILQSTSDSQAVSEITTSKHVLESMLDEPVGLFAYPNGKPDVDYAARHVEMVKQAGFLAAVSTSPGVATKSSDVFELPRFGPWDRTRLRYGLRMLTNLRSALPRVAKPDALQP